MALGVWQGADLDLFSCRLASLLSVLALALDALSTVHVLTLECITEPEGNRKERERKDFIE